MSADKQPETKDVSETPQTPKLPEEKTSVTHHELVIDGETIAYSATTGLMHLRNEQDKKTAAIFYVAYVKDDVADQSERPITFCFNGGPGSCSVWLHLGAYGPQRIEMEDGVIPRPNQGRLVDNEHSLLDITDLVFIDPVGTGFSRSGEDGKDEDFHQVDGDADSVCQFIERYLNKNHRWASPKFLSGESYGTTRAGAMSTRLQERGIALNGMVLVSLAVNFQTFIFDLGNDLPYLTFMPTFAAVAWHHGKLGEDVPTTLDELLDEVREWCFDVYGPALMRGTQLTNERKREVAQQMARFIGMDAAEIEALDLRVADMRFSKSILGRVGHTVGRMDGRYVGPDVDRDHRRTQRDPSIEAPMGLYTGLINDHIRRTLEFEHDATYDILSFKVNRNWKWARDKKIGYPDTSDELRRAMISNPHMKVLFANGIYDLATPFFAAEYTANHLELEPNLRENIVLTYYPAGHMMYFHRDSHRQLKADIAALFRSALS